MDGYRFNADRPLSYPQAGFNALARLLTDHFRQGANKISNGKTKTFIRAAKKRPRMGRRVNGRRALPGNGRWSQRRIGFMGTPDTQKITSGVMRPEEALDLTPEGQMAGTFGSDEAVSSRTRRQFNGPDENIFGADSGLIHGIHAARATLPPNAT